MIIFCDINKFELNQPIYLVDPNTNNYSLLQTAAMDDIGHVVSKLSYEQHVSEIILSGGNENFL